MTYRETSQRKSLILLSPAQVRAGRALLDISQIKLAELANLGVSTVVDFEKSRRRVSDAALQDMRAALQSAGLIFVSENGGGPGVRLKKRAKRTKT